MDERIRRLNQLPDRPAGGRVLYWCRANRRADANHALRFAVGLANRLEKPLVVLETLSCGGPHANARRHTFVLEGVPETAAAMAELGAGYVFHLPRTPEEDGRALEYLVCESAAVVTDEWFVPPPEFDRAAWAVDSSCIVPSAEIPRVYAAYSMRPQIRKVLTRFLKPVPPVKLVRRFVGPVSAFHTTVEPAAIPGLVASCRIDHAVPPSLAFHGGRGEARKHLATFLRHRLHRYAREKNEPSRQATSDLSPYLHFGWISSLEIALAVQEAAARRKLAADEFLEELIVRRELAFNFAKYAARIDSRSELPAWARDTLDRHHGDPRDPLYTHGQFERAETHDALWNATENELLLTGKIHGYYRMYWGKKILEWSATPEQALETMIELNDRYALDGQDPNTYGNILWCFGLHDRPWPERPIYGTVRSMSLAGMSRKTDTVSYIRDIEILKVSKK